MTDLETRLIEVGELLDVPSAPDMASRVGVQIRTASPGVRTARPLASRAKRRVVVVVAAALVAIGAAAAAPAIADWLGLRGVKVHQQPAPPISRSSVPTTQLDLGRRVSLAEASRISGITPLLPERLGGPQAVWVDMSLEAPVISLIYETALVSEFDADMPEQPILHKFVDPKTRIEPLTIGGHRALWFEGVHEVALQTETGPIFDRLRLSDNALLIERGSITVRIETKLGRDEAIRIAESLR